MGLNRRGDSFAHSKYLQWKNLLRMNDYKIIIIKMNKNTWFCQSISDLDTGFHSLTAYAHVCIKSHWWNQDSSVSLYLNVFICQFFLLFLFLQQLNATQCNQSVTYDNTFVNPSSSRAIYYSATLLLCSIAATHLWENSVHAKNDTWNFVSVFFLCILI